MSSPTIGRGPDPALLDRLASMLGSHIDEEQRVIPLGHRDIGSDQSTLRFRASRACEWVSVHVQSTAPVSVANTLGLIARGLNFDGTRGLYGRGLAQQTGDDVDYDSSASIDLTRIDCRENRQQEYTVTRNGTDRYIAYLVPEFLEVDGTYTKFDGEDSEDRMSFIDLGV